MEKHVIEKIKAVGKAIAEGDPETIVSAYRTLKMTIPVYKTDGVKFVCPKCQNTRLECVMDGVHECEVFNIDAEGDFDFGDVAGGDDCDRFQCLECGFTLEVNDGFGAYCITDHEEIAKWCKKNCKQE